MRHKEDNNIDFYYCAWLMSIYYNYIINVYK